MNQRMHLSGVAKWSAAGALFACLGLAAAGRCDSGAEVVVLYNSALPESRQVAEYYAQRRQVPTNQVWGFNLPPGENISRPDYLEKLQRPLLNKLAAAGLFTFKETTNGGQTSRQLVDAKIRYAALCYGVPIRIQADPNLVEPEAEKRNVTIKRNEASVDSQLACLPVEESQFLWTGPWPNRFYSTTNASQLHPTNGILLVTRLDGLTPEIARGLVDKALEAETNGLWGRAYCDVGWGKTGPQFELGDQWIGAAARLSRALGFETEIDDQRETIPASVPLSQVAFYAGWYASSVCGPFTWRGVEFMPGAVAYHLHSFSALSVRSTNQGWVATLLARGATATLGSVDEPYLGGTPDIGVLWSRLTVFGFSFGEAAWASQNVLSWQNLAVGDPLYRPFALRPEQRYRQLEQRGSRLADWYYLMVVNMTLARNNDTANALNLLESMPPLRTSAILREKQAELYWASKKLSDALDAGEQALKLSPTPIQKLRLLLRQSERLEFYGRKQPALDRCRQLLQEFPDYPDKAAIYQRATALARALGKNDEAVRLEKEAQKSPSGTNGTPQL